MIFGNKQMDFMLLENRISKALKPLQKIITDLQKTNDSIANDISENHGSISLKREEIDNLKIVNQHLSETKVANEATIEKINNLFKGEC